jgi:peptide/nickel transport system substrate-binding protein
MTWPTTPSSRAPRRRRLAVGALAVSAVLLTAACGSSSGTAAGPSSTVAAPTDKTLHLSFLQDPGQPPDPDIFYASQGLLLTTNMYEGLLTYASGTEKPTIVPSLAEKWTVSADKKSYTFELRKGVVFQDGTPFNAAAIKPSIDRRLAVNGGPSYTVADITSVVPKGDYEVTITLKQPTSIFLDLLASPYGLKILSPTALAANAGSDHAQTYLQTHSIGTGPYLLSDAKVGSHYALKAFDKYWGGAPYFTDVDIPVLSDSSSQQLQFTKGQLSAVLHDLPSSAVAAYQKNTAVKSYSLPTFMSDYMFVNPNNVFGKSQANRTALLQAIDRNELLAQGYAGRGKVAGNAYPANMTGTGAAPQNVEYKPDVLKALVATLPADQKTITIGYDSGSSSDQLLSNLISAKLGALGLQAKVQGYPTSQVFGWINDVKGAPDVLVNIIWPDAAPAYTWGHIAWGKGAGLNYLQCSDPAVDAALAAGLASGSEADFDKAGTAAVATGCFFNLVDINDFMVAQPWLKGVAEAHTVAEPNTLRLNKLSVG